MALAITTDLNNNVYFADVDNGGKASRWHVEKLRTTSDLLSNDDRRVWEFTHAPAPHANVAAGIAFSKLDGGSIFVGGYENLGTLNRKLP